MKTRREPRTDLHIPISEALRARLEACAAAEGLDMPEYARAALVSYCGQTEREADRRERARAIAAGYIAVEA